ncbi:MAG: response regulator [Lachnospiraceae bacterium]|nr:response regulator [Lachnospiraceae bacterium]
MIKLFLVEDEIVMRDGIKKHIDWEKEGIEFVGEASDGELAYPLISERKPDIVITDIKMPFMDGLKLSALVKKILPDTKIIILSGYDEFSYAREAIRLGVTEYLLKPISPAALLESIRKVRDNIINDKKKKQSEQSQKAEFEEKEREALKMFSELTKHFMEKPSKEEESRDSYGEVDISKAGSVSGKNLEDFLKTGSINDTKDIMDRIFFSIGEQNARSMIYLNYITMDMYFTMLSFLKELSVDPSEFGENCGDINDVIKSIRTVDDSKEFLIRCLDFVMEKRDSGSGKKYGRILGDAKAYIDEHFSDEDISLNTLADILNISPNHFSAIFSQEMGITFIEYLINKRMDRAKELLMTTDMKTFEVAYAVGYKDPSYFSSTFKKTQGMTVREYRSRGREN